MKGTSEELKSRENFPIIIAGGNVGMVIRPVTRSVQNYSQLTHRCMIPYTRYKRNKIHGSTLRSEINSYVSTISFDM